MFVAARVRARIVQSYLPGGAHVYPGSAVFRLACVTNTQQTDRQTDSHMARCVTFAVARIPTVDVLEIGEILHIFPSGTESMGDRGSKKAYTGPRTGIYLPTKFGCDRSIVVGCRSRNDRQTSRQTDKQNGMTIRLNLCERDATDGIGDKSVKISAYALLGVTRLKIRRFPLNSAGTTDCSCVTASDGARRFRVTNCSFLLPTVRFTHVRCTGVCGSDSDAWMQVRQQSAGVR